MPNNHRWLQATLMISLSSLIGSTASAEESLDSFIEIASHKATPKQVIVKFKENTLGTLDVSQLDQLGVSVKKSFTLPASRKNPSGKSSTPKTISVLSINDGSTVKTVIEKLEASGLVEYAEPDYELSISDTIPNDPSFAQLWGMDNTGQTGGVNDADIDAVEAWDIHKGGNSVVVAVVDTGIDYDHVDLSQNMWTNPGEIAGNGLDDDGNGYIDDIYGIDCFNGDSDPYDDHSHGTHVAGTIGARGGNSTGVVGVNWRTKMMALKFLSGSGSGSTAGAIECLTYAANMATRTSDPVNLKVTNNSWGGGAYSQSLLDTFNALGDAGVLSAVAAGNDSSDIDSGPTYPASYNAESIISVASTDHTDSMSYFSNYGAVAVDLGAPGSAILSTVPGDDYASYNGTSMASPHVAGALAYLWTYEPSYTPGSLKNLIMSTGDSIPALAGTTVSGKRLNLFNSLSCSPGNPTLSASQPQQGFSLTSGEETTIQATISDCGVPQTGEVVRAYFSSGENTIALRDNGVDADAVADDGIYSAYWTPSEVSASLTIDIETRSGLTDSVSGQVISNYAISDATYDWVDATGGTEISINSDDTYEEVDLDFNFQFYGETYSRLFVSSNGLISFGSGSSALSNTELPNPNTPNNIIAAYWDDLHMGYSVNSRAYKYTDGVSPNRRTVISWNDIKRYGYSSGGEASFQVHLYESSGDIVIQYKDVEFGSASYDFGASATIGIENSSGDLGALFSYNSTEPLTSSDGYDVAISNERAIRFSMTPDHMVPLLLNEDDTTKRGWLYNGGESYEDGSIFYSFANDGSSRQLRLKGYDVDTNNELCVYLNGAALSERVGCLRKGSNNRLTDIQTFIIPIENQVAGTNVIEIRSRTPSQRWGVKNVGLYDFPTGYLPLEMGGIVDRNKYGWRFDSVSNYKRNVTFVTNVPEASEESDSTRYFIKMRGYDIDSNSEVCLTLNDTQPLGCLLAGSNNSLTVPWFFFLPPGSVTPGYNFVKISQSEGGGEKWGVKNLRVIPVVIPEEPASTESWSGPLSELPEGVVKK